MKLNKLFYLLVAVCAIFTACGDGTASEEQSAKGYLTVIDQQVGFDFYGGQAEIYYVISDGSVVDNLREVLGKVNAKVAAGEITEEGKKQKLIAMYNEWNDATEMSVPGQQAWQEINAAIAALIGG